MADELPAAYSGDSCADDSDRELIAERDVRLQDWSSGGRATIVSPAEIGKPTYDAEAVGGVLAHELAHRLGCGDGEPNAALASVG